MQRIKRIFQSVLIQQIAAWVTVAGIVYLVLYRGFKLMISQPLLFTIFLALGIISSSLIFSVHAYLFSKKTGRRQIELETRQSELASGIQKSIIDEVHRIDTTITDLKNEIKKKALKFPLPAWLTGSDIMRIFDISYNQLIQHIEDGLAGYIRSLGTQGEKMRQITKRDLIALDVEEEGASYSRVEQWQFKTEDIEKFIKNT